MSDLGRRLFPGTKAVWIAALVAVLVGLAGVGKTLTKQQLALTGTNSVGIGTVIARADPSQLSCVRNLIVPPRTGRIQLWMGVQQPTSPRPRLIGAMTTASGRSWRVDAPIANDGFGHFRDFPLRPGTTGDREERATFCFTVRGAAADLGGASVNGFPGAKPTTVNGAELGGTDVSVRFLSDTRTGGRLYTRMDEALERAALFKGLPGGSLTLWVFLLAFAVAVPYCVIRTAATVEDHSVRTLARRATAVAAFAGIAWAVMLSPLHGADEPEHLSYAQYVAETGERASTSPSPRLAYSSDLQTLMGAVRHSSTVLNDTSRVRWDDLSPAAYEALPTTGPRDDGGGFTESASGHSPFYYSIVAIPYKVFAGGLDLAELNVVMRVWTALLAALVAGLAVWCASLLLPRWPAVWWLAGMLAALQPVFNSISGTVNNDTAVNLLAALAVTLLVHAWRRGPQTSTMVGLGVTTALLPIAKITGFALWPVVAVGLGVVLLAHRRRDALLRLLIVPGVGAAMLLLWILVLAPLVGGDRGVLVNAHPGLPASGAPPAEPAGGGISHLDQLSYLVQMFVPFVQLTGDHWSQQWPVYSVYIERGYGRFGWLDAGLAFRVLQALTVALIAGWALALVAAGRHARAWRQWLPGAGILAFAIAVVVAFVAVAYATETPRAVPGEQGRYIFPALVPMAVLFAGGLAAVPAGRVRAWALGGVAALLPLFGLYAWLSAVADYYT